MSDQQSLFEELAANEGHRLGLAPAPYPLLSQDVEILEGWAKSGIPADLSTVEHACNVLMGLWRERNTWLALVDELLDSYGEAS